MATLDRVLVNAFESVGVDEEKAFDVAEAIEHTGAADVQGWIRLHSRMLTVQIGLSVAILIKLFHL